MPLPGTLSLAPLETYGTGYMKTGPSPERGYATQVRRSRKTELSKRLTDSQTGSDGGELGKLTGHRVNLDPQLPGWNQNQDPGNLGCFRLVN